MKKISEIMIFIILIVVPISLISINSELIVGDEIWNFQNVYKLVNGYKMYVDCNIIITPIFYIFGYFFVKLFSSTILGFRIYNIFIFFTLILSSLLLFKTLNINKIMSFIYSLIILLFIMPYIST